MALRLSESYMIWLMEQYCGVTQVSSKCGVLTELHRQHVPTTTVASLGTKRLLLRGTIVDMKNCGKSTRKIAAELGISKSTVCLWLRRWEREQKLTDRPRGRPPRKTSSESDRQIQEMAESNPFTNAVVIQEQLQLGLSARTIRRRLREGGLLPNVPVKVQRMFSFHRKERLRFAQQYLEEGLDYWGRAIFSGETTFYYTLENKIHCWRNLGR